MNPRTLKNKKWSGHKVGTEVARGAREIVKSQMETRKKTRLPN